MSEFKREYLTRQADIIPIEATNERITIIGAGGIGSNTAISLARMGFSNLLVFDPDEVSDVNMNNQGYNIHDIGQPEVEALQGKIKGIMGFDIDIEKRYFTALSQAEGTVIMAVDSMSARKTIWSRSFNNALVIDGRMASEYAIIYAIKPNDDRDRQEYTNSLFDDESANREACTAKATIYTTNLISGLICKIVKDWVLENPYMQKVSWDIKNNDLNIRTSKGGFIARMK